MCILKVCLNMRVNRCIFVRSRYLVYSTVSVCMLVILLGSYRTKGI